jgi:methyl-accepting chemotaxis protein
MKLRTRILLGYWYLVALLIVSAVAATLGFQGLGSSIGTVLEENFDSVRASMMMLDALERQDSAVLAILLGEQQTGESLKRTEGAFSDAVRSARDNVTLAEEAPVLDEIEQLYAEFRTARDRLIAEPRERPLWAYESETLPRFLAVKGKVFELLDLNHRAMVKADEWAQRAASLRALGHGLLVLVALVSLAFLSQALGRQVLDRLADLGSVARAIASGDRDRRAAAVLQDELGAVAEQLNAVLDRLAEAEGSVEGRLRQVRQLVVALLDELPRPAAVVSLSGALIASTLKRDLADFVERAARRLPAVAGCDSGEFSAIIEGQAVRFRVLCAGNVRPVGWLAIVDGEGD